MLKATGIGRVTQAPEMRYLDNGTAITNVGLSVRNGWKREGDQYPPTMWLRLTFWGKSGEIVNQYLKQGDSFFFSGELVHDRDTGNPRVYVKNDGTAAASFELKVTDFEFVGGGETRSADAGSPPGQAVAVAAIEEDDIPF